MHKAGRTPLFFKATDVRPKLGGDCDPRIGKITAAAAPSPDDYLYLWIAFTRCPFGLLGESKQAAELANRRSIDRSILLA
jgi:hypothetical protein